MTTVTTNLGTRETARKLRVEKTGSVTATDVQKAIEAVAATAASAVQFTAGGAYPAASGANITGIGYGNIAGVPATSLLGNATGSAAAPTGIALGNGLTFVSTALNGAKPVNAQVGTTYTVVMSDRNKIVQINNAGAVTINILSAVTAGSGFTFDLSIRGGGTAAISATAGNIDGAASLSLASGLGLTFSSDGANWFTSGASAGWSGLSYTTSQSLNSAQQAQLRLNANSYLQTGCVNLWNGKITATASAGALTVSLVTLAGNTPSVSDPVIVWFRNSTLTDGSPSIAVITSATTIVAPSGSTFGIPSSRACKVWVSLFYSNATTAYLALGQTFNFSSTTPIIAPLGELNPTTGTLITAGSTASGIWYSSTDIGTNSANALVAYLEWSSGMTAGTWVAPTKIQPFTPGTPKPGELLPNRVAVNGGVGSSTSSTTPVDITGATVTITLTSNAHCVDVYGDLSAIAAAGGVGTNTVHASRLLRGAVDLSTSKTIGVVSGSGTNQQTQATASHACLDYVGSAGAITYKMQHYAASAASNTTSSAIHLRAVEVAT